MMVLHGICTGEVHRPWRKVNEDGEVREGRIDRWSVFDGRQTFECQLSDEYGTPPAVGDVVTASVVAVSEFQRRPQVTLGGPVDPDVVKAFTPELAAMLIATGLAPSAAAGRTPARVAS